MDHSDVVVPKSKVSFSCFFVVVCNIQQCYTVQGYGCTRRKEKIKVKEQSLGYWTIQIRTVLLTSVMCFFGNPTCFYQLTASCIHNFFSSTVLSFNFSIRASFLAAKAVNISRSAALGSDDKWSPEDKIVWWLGSVWAETALTSVELTCSICEVAGGAISSEKWYAF